MILYIYGRPWRCGRSEIRAIKRFLSLRTREPDGSSAVTFSRADRHFRCPFPISLHSVCRETVLFLATSEKSVDRYGSDSRWPIDFFVLRLIYVMFSRPGEYRRIQYAVLWYRKVIFSRSVATTRFLFASIILCSRVVFYSTRNGHFSNG